jgi:uncharacterized protein
MFKDIAIPEAEIAAFCKRWQVSELALFGSVLRDDFRLDSDIYVLVTFKPVASYKLADLQTMEYELRTIFQRDVDLGERRAVEEDPNCIRRKAILNSAQVIYAEG